MDTVSSPKLNCMLYSTRQSTHGRGYLSPSPPMSTYSVFMECQRYTLIHAPTKHTTSKRHVTYLGTRDCHIYYSIPCSLHFIDHMYIAKATRTVTVFCLKDTRELTLLVCRCLTTSKVFWILTGRSFDLRRTSKSNRATVVLIIHVSPSPTVCPSIS